MQKKIIALEKIQVRSRAKKVRSHGLSLVQQYVSDLEPLDILTPAEERELVKHFKEEKDKHQDRFIQGNLRFVIRIAQQYLGLGVPLIDLVQAGNIGLLTAYEKFRTDKNVRFLSYAVYDVRQAIRKTITTHAYVVKLPHKKIELFLRIKKARLELQQVLGREPKLSEVASHCRLSEKKVLSIMKLNEKADSLDRKAGTETEQTLLSFIEDPHGELFKKMLEREKFFSELDKVLADVLTIRESQVIKLHNAIGIEKKWTLRELGALFHLSPEAIRLIEIRAKKKLKRDRRFKLLKDYL
ncbi:RNA polymerase sigma factor RpoD/SigA [Candidatus Margulisiibacteriota bacterium]